MKKLWESYGVWILGVLMSWNIWLHNSIFELKLFETDTTELLENMLLNFDDIVNQGTVPRSEKAALDIVKLQAEVNYLKKEVERLRDNQK